MRVALFGITPRLREVIEGLQASGRFRPVAIIDPGGELEHRRLFGLTVYGERRTLASLFRNRRIEGLVLLRPFRNQEQQERFLRWAVRYQVRFFRLPPLEEFLQRGEVQALDPARLLSRPLALRPTRLLRKALHSRRILVTGAAGSIGRELARLLARFQTGHLFLLDQAETPLAQLRDALDRWRNPALSIEYILADVTHEEHMKWIVQTVKPDIILHAAAYKHVPVAEENPYEVVRTNLYGTYVVMRYALEVGCQRFVYISTDKAVNPVGIMGMSKRAGELLLLTTDPPREDQRLIIVRFGNVLGSAGSVVQIFWRKIQRREPLPVTHPEATRYFMSIREACLLVLESAVRGEHHGIYLLDMGKPVRVVDLARKMLALAGLTPRDVPIQFTGLRPGEKLHEELAYPYEVRGKTAHPRIWQVHMSISLNRLEVRKRVFQVLNALLTPRSDRAYWHALLQEVISAVGGNFSGGNQFSYWEGQQNAGRSCL